MKRLSQTILELELIANEAHEVAKVLILQAEEPNGTTSIIDEAKKAQLCLKGKEFHISKVGCTKSGDKFEYNFNQLQMALNWLYV